MPCSPRYGQDRCPTGPLLTLPDTGLVRAVAGGWHLLADVGAACPDQLPAHAHADTFGCLLHVDGAELIVETGTSTYAPGAVRDYERSTAAHSTVEVDGADSTEVWGAFRAGRRARVRDLVIRGGAHGVTLEAAHDGYRALPGRPCHRRRWSLSNAGLRVDDLVTGSGRHAVVIRWHLAPESAAWLEPEGVVVTIPAGVFRATVTAGGRMTLDIDRAPVAAGFLCTTDSPVLTCRVTAVLPVRVTTCWRSARDPHRVANIEGGV